jgi:hypothetical protein
MRPLVFRLGHDSNSTCGITVFLEEDPENTTMRDGGGERERGRFF